MLNNPHIVSLLGIAISSICTIIVAYIQVSAKRREKRDEERDRKHYQYTKLIMEMVSASCDLGLVNAIALQGGHLNGNVEAAMTRAEKAQSDYHNFLQKTIAKTI